jgi:hypothetical protein
MAANPRTDVVIRPYDRLSPPSDPQAHAVFLAKELARLQETLSALAEGAAQVADRPPAAPKRGMQRYATGAWATTLGAEGLYVYKSTGWTLVA